MCEWRAVPTLAVRAPRALALRIRLMYNEVWWRLLSVAARNFCLSCLEGRVKACMHSLSSFGMVHQGWRSVAESGLLTNRMGGVAGVLVYITQYGGRSACRQRVTASFWFSGMPSQSATTLLTAVSARSLPVMFVCPRILCSIVNNPSSALYRRESTIAVMSGLWW